MKNLSLQTSLILLTTVILLACASDKDDGSAGEEEIEYQRIGGTTALGRPGSWATNCLAEACAGSNAEGYYLLSTEVDQSSIMFSDTPQDDGSDVRLYSRYRHDAEVTSSLVNFNPSTHAILDIWSMVDQNMSIDQCANDTACATSLMTSFTVEDEEIIIDQMSTLMGTMWPTGRNPFSDVYIADPDITSDTYDILDEMHDHFSFVVTDSDLLVLDNNGNELSKTPLEIMVANRPNALTPLTSDQITESKNIDPPAPPSGSPIQILYKTSPSLASEIEQSSTFLVNAINSRSSNLGPLTFTHEVTDPYGFIHTFSTVEASITLEHAGNYIWILTVADSANYSLKRGFVVRVSATEDAEPTFGGDGSCLTSPLTANSLNICEETQNGGSLGACEPLDSGATTLRYSPVPCAREVQNEGELFGVCTMLDVEIRVFMYDNPERPNTVDSFSDKQADASAWCSNTLAGSWSTSP